MNNRWRQKNKAFHRYVLHSSQMTSKEIPYDLMVEVKSVLNSIAYTIVRDLKQTETAMPKIWSEPIPQMVVYGRFEVGLIIKP